MHLIHQLFQRIKHYLGGTKCPKCGDWIGDGEDVCQTCGYPWSD